MLLNTHGPIFCLKLIVDSSMDDLSASSYQETVFWDALAVPTRLGWRELGYRRTLSHLV